MLDYAGPRSSDWCPCKKRKDQTHPGTEATPREGGGKNGRIHPQDEECLHRLLAASGSRGRGVEQILPQPPKRNQASQTLILDLYPQEL